MTDSSKTGRDIAIKLLLLGAENLAVTAPLVASGCIMMACHHTASTLQLVRRTEHPSMLLTSLYFIAEEFRGIMAHPGFRNINLFQSQKLNVNKAIPNTTKQMD